MVFGLSGLRLVAADSATVSLSSTQCVVTFDEHDVMFMHDLRVELQPTSEKLCTEREQIDELLLKSNKVTSVSMSQFKVVFPYQYRFGDCWKQVRLLYAPSNFCSILAT